MTEEDLQNKMHGKGTTTHNIHTTHKHVDSMTNLGAESVKKCLLHKCESLSELTKKKDRSYSTSVSSDKILNVFKSTFYIYIFIYT